MKAEVGTAVQRLFCGRKEIIRIYKVGLVSIRVSLVPDFRFIRSLNLHAGAFLESLVTFVRAGVGLSHVTIAHINCYYIIILYVSNCSMKC